MASTSEQNAKIELKKAIKDSNNYSCVYIKNKEERPTNCLRCEHDFKVPAKLYNHLWNNKTDCNKDSNVSIEEARKYANAPDYYKCDYCEQVIVNKTEREKHQAICDHKDLIDNLEINGIDPIISYLFCSNDDGKIVSNIDKETGYINATLMCKSSGKEWKHYISLDSTKELIKELEILKEKESFRHEVGIPTSCLITFQDNNKKELEILKEKESFSITFQDSIIIQKPSFINPKVKHTYVHELLAINLAQWCSAKYGLLVSQFIMKFRNGLIKTEDSLKAKNDIKDIMNGKLDSVTNYTNKYDSQVYFIGFDVNFKDLKAIYVNSKEKFNENDGFIIKYGNQKKNSTRQTTHKSSFDNYKLLDSIKCYDQDNLEKFVEEIITENRIKIIDPNKISGNEYIYFKTQEDYKDLIDKVIIKAEELNKAINDDLYGNNDIELKKLEICLKEKELIIKEKELQLKEKEEETKQMELKLKEKELDYKYNKTEEVSNNDNKEKNIIIKIEEINNKETKTNTTIVKTRKPKTNLRIPHKNIKMKDDKKIKFHGVAEIKYKNKDYSSYNARLYDKNKLKYLGTYRTPELAAYAYDCMRVQLFGEEAKLNNVNEPEDWKWNKDLHKLEYIKEN